METEIIEKSKIITSSSITRQQVQELYVILGHKSTGNHVETIRDIIYSLLFMSHQEYIITVVRYGIDNARYELSVNNSEFSMISQAQSIALHDLLQGSSLAKLLRNHKHM